MNQAPVEPAPHQSLAIAGALYVLLLLAGLGWLWARDRGSQLAALAIGERGPWVGSAAGLAIGLAGAYLLGLVARRSKSLQEVERHARILFVHVDDTAAMAFLLVAVVAEEVFFRLAVQDALGLPSAVAIYVLLNSSIAGPGVIAITAVHAVVLGLLVQQGFGLLGATTAHAIMNHLSLRRILCT